MITAIEVGLVLLALFLLLVLSNVPISVSLGMSSIIVMLVYGIPIGTYVDLMVSGMRKFSYLAIPFFILSGILMDRSGVAAKIIRFFKSLIGAIPGGLAVVSIVVNIFWGAVSGAGPATVAALGGVLIPSMEEDGYDTPFASALVAAAGGISIIIPPSIAFIVYGVLANVSIGGIFIAGIIPGLILGLCLIVYAVVYCKRRGYRGSGRVSGREIWRSFKEAALGLLSPVIILGGIYGGIFTPTEAAAVSVLYSLILALVVYRTMSLKDMFRVFASSGESAASIMIIIGDATVFSYVCTIEGVATAASRGLAGVSSSNIVTLLVMMLILLIAGCLINGNSILYIFVPIMLPIAKQMGYDPMWFGIFMVMASAVGMITPPVAINLYPAAHIGGISLSSISKAILPFVGVSIIATVIIMLFPSLSLWLPGLMMG